MAWPVSVDHKVGDNVRPCNITDIAVKWTATFQATVITPKFTATLPLGSYAFNSLHNVANCFPKHDSQFLKLSRVTEVV